MRAAPGPGAAFFQCQAGNSGVLGEKLVDCVHTGGGGVERVADGLRVAYQNMPSFLQAETMSVVSRLREPTEMTAASQGMLVVFSCFV